MKTIISGLLASLLVLGSLPSHADALDVVAMAPDHVGITMRSSPVLYFYISDATSLPVRFILVDPRRVSPMLEVLLPSPTGPGEVAIRLKDYNIKLDPDVVYRWYVSITTVQGEMSKDVVAGGAIECCPQDISFLYDGPCNKETVYFFAKHGIWYDAMACLNELIEANAQDQSLRRMRYELLRQVGIILLTAQ